MFRSISGFWGAAWLVVAMVSSTALAQQECPPSYGDVTGGPGTDIVDVQCGLLVVLWELGGATEDPPDCAVRLAEVDADCSLDTSVVDIQLLIALTLDSDLAPELDSNENGCVDVCEELGWFPSIDPPLNAGEIDFACEDPVFELDVLIEPDEPDLDTTAVNARMEEIVSSGGTPVLWFGNDTASPMRYLRMGMNPPADSVKFLDDGTKQVQVEAGDLLVAVRQGAPGAAPPTSDPNTVWLFSGDIDPEEVEIVWVFAREPDTTGALGPAILHKVYVADSASDDAPALDSIELTDTQAAGAASTFACTATALSQLNPLPNHMPPFKFPEIQLEDCPSDNACVIIQRSWILGHFHTWRAKQMLDYIAASTPAKRPFLWGRLGTGPGGALADGHYEPRDWFGEYTEYRFEGIRKVVEVLWNKKYHDHKDPLGLNLKLQCANPINIEDACFSKQNPTAHHIYPGFVTICDKYFNDANYADPLNGRQNMPTHEMIHWISIFWRPNGGLPDWEAPKDVHFHAHGLGCGIAPVSEAMYGSSNGHHLANYVNSNGFDCFHRQKAVMNNDSYTRWIYFLGRDIYLGNLTVWPKPGPSAGGICADAPEPTPPPEYYDPVNDPCTGPKGEDWCGGTGEVQAGIGALVNDLCVSDAP